jgi:CubicO group peptidase (beta-lactamase class C family)
MRGFLIVGIAIIAAAGRGSDLSVAPPDYWPTEAWRSDSPGEHNLDPDLLAQAVGPVEGDLPFLDGLIIIRDGYILYERYFNGNHPDALYEIASMTKSWTSAAIGSLKAGGI